MIYQTSLFFIKIIVLSFINYIGIVNKQRINLR